MAKTQNKVHKPIRRSTTDRLYDVPPIERMDHDIEISLKDFKDKIDDMRFQLVEYWCLCDYCTLYDNNNEKFPHWRNELDTIINNLKHLNPIHENKKDVLRKMLVDDYDYKEPEMIVRIIRDRFNHERITDWDKVDQVCEDFAKHIMSILEDVSSPKSLSI